MIQRVISFAEDRWEDWFTEPPRGALVPLVVTHSSKINRRAAMFLFDGPHRSPQALVKLAFTEPDVASAEAEFRALSTVHSLLPSELSRTAPRPLALHPLDAGVTVLAQTVLPGQRLLLPGLTGRSSVMAPRLLRRQLQRILLWTQRLAVATGREMQSDPHPLVEVVDHFDQAFHHPAPARRALEHFREGLHAARIQFRPCWQHGDVSVGNALVHRGEMRFADWEHASGSSEPWRDAAQIPSSLFVLARAEAPRHDAPDLAARTLGVDTWPGRVVRAMLETAWTYPIPLAWAVLVSTMRQALQAQKFSPTGGLAEAELVHLLLSPGHARQSLAWLVPEA